MTAVRRDASIAVVTIVSGRHDHLRAQLRGLDVGTVVPGRHVVVAMDDPDVHSLVDGRPDTTVLDLQCGKDGLELAAARNLGAGSAVDAGADLLVFLDVDCVPGRDLLDTYRRAAGTTDAQKLLFCGPVTYLPADHDLRALESSTDPHPARPNPAVGNLLVDDEVTLFWSLSFAITAANWRAIGGFHTGYRGYGGEDTDFAMTASAKGFRLCWVGGAHAYHQWHPVSDPPVEHIDDILRNAAVFRDRWHWWPMDGWLRAFEDTGLITYDSDRRCWCRTDRSPQPRS